MHCLADPLVLAPDGDWFCPDCCKVCCKLKSTDYSLTPSQELGLPEDYMPPVPEYEIPQVAVDPTTSVTPQASSSSSSSSLLKIGNEPLPDQGESRKRHLSSLSSGPGSRKKSTSAASTGSLLDDALIRVLGEKKTPSASPATRVYVPEPPPPLLDYCLVCRQKCEDTGGELTKCDFPDCRRMYHAVNTKCVRVNGFLCPHYELLC